MGNCCGTQRKQTREEYQLKSTEEQNLAGQALGGSTLSGASSREAMLLAAEKRKAEAENRGVLKGGKLSKKLAEEQTKKQEYAPKNDDALVWD